MSNNDFLTIKEASKLTGKADITIRRLIKQKIKQNDEVSTQMIRRAQTPSGNVYEINKEYLLKELKLPTQLSTQVSRQNEQSEYSNDEGGYANDKVKENESAETLKTKDEGGIHLSTQVSSQDLLKAKQETISILKGELFKKDEQLNIKDEQIKKKDEQFSEFLERDREKNILLKGLQDKVLMLGQPNKTGFFKSFFKLK